MSLVTRPEPRYSLQKRLFLVFGILLVLFLGLAGFVLDRAFKESVAASVNERLLLQVYALLGVAETDSSGFFIPELEEARFSQIGSGLYGFILDSRNREVWRSLSALNLDFQEIGPRTRMMAPGEVRYGRIDTDEQGTLAYASYGTYWESLDEEYTFLVLESVAPSEAEIREFQRNLWTWLGGLALFLALAQFFLLRWGLRPLQNLADDLGEIEAGRKNQLEENYPSELQSVSHNLNELIKSERERQSRYRTTLDDLAHSLKTPLSVVSGIVQQSSSQEEGVSQDQADEIAEQVGRMNQIISYQLKRAVKSEHARVLAKAVNVAGVLRKVSSALDKVYRDKAVQLDMHLQEDAVFYGDESDLTEVLGNLLDNAYKYCEGRVRVSLEQRGRHLGIDIEDDGSGISEENRLWVLERGARADSLESGQGIGLAVALEIVGSYGGDIRVDGSALGGASVKVTIQQS